MPSAKIQTTYVKQLTKAFYAFGDSITHSSGLGTFFSDQYPEKVAQFLRNLGAPIFARNFGNSGYTSADELAAIPQALAVPVKISRTGTTVEVPVLTTVMVGVNDPGGGLSQAQTQSNIEQAIRSIKNGVAGIVSTPASLPATHSNVGITSASQNTLGWKGPFVPNSTRFLVQADNSTTGGFNIGSPLTPPTVTGVLGGSPPSIWVYRNAQAGESGWSRVADNTDDAIGCQKILIISAQWLNFVNGLGDTLTTPFAGYVNVRAAQLAAADAQSVPFFDLHAYQRALIVAGVVGDSSGAWSNLTNNQHPNALACESYATGIVSALGGDNTYVSSVAKMPTGSNSWTNLLM